MPPTNRDFIYTYISRREREVLYYVAESKTNRQIAELLFISPATVNNHRARISEKLQLSGRHGLMLYALSVKHLLGQPLKNDSVVLTK